MKKVLFAVALVMGLGSSVAFAGNMALVQLAMPDGYGVRGFVRDNLPIIPDTFTLVPRQVRTCLLYTSSIIVLNFSSLTFILFGSVVLCLTTFGKLAIEPTFSTNVE